MSNQFLKLRRSAVPGRIPTTSSLDFGEIALNTYDGLAFMKKSGSSGEQIVTLGTGTSGSFTGSFSGSFTGSLLGTASWAQNAVTSSYILQAVSASFATTAANAVTSSYILNAVSASFASTASYVLNAVSSSFAATASIATSASFASTASSADNFLVRGTLTAQTIVAQTITSSTEFITGSTKFGSLITDTHQFTGSVSITGSLTVVGAGITGSLFGTSSWAQNAVTSSYILQAVSASFATSAANATTASYVLNAVSASFASTAANATTASYVVTAQTASYVLNAVSASFATTAANATTASYVLQAVSASFASTASIATSASYAANGGVTQIVAGTNVTISPTSGTGSVTINATAGAAFPFTGSAVITGSLTVTGSISATNGFTGSLFGTSSFATSASFAVSASWAPSAGGSGLATKAGTGSIASFTGNPKKSTITFASAFPNASYAVAITGEDARSWIVESKVSGSFIINSNSNTAPVGTTYWIATAFGETA